MNELQTSNELRIMTDDMNFMTYDLWQQIMARDALQITNRESSSVRVMPGTQVPRGKKTSYGWEGRGSDSVFQFSRRKQMNHPTKQTKNKYT